MYFPRCSGAQGERIWQIMQHIVVAWVKRTCFEIPMDFPRIRKHPNSLGLKDQMKFQVRSLPSSPRPLLSGFVWRTWLARAEL